jgi:hypothetical protein
LKFAPPPASRIARSSGHGISIRHTTLVQKFILSMEYSGLASLRGARQESDRLDNRRERRIGRNLGDGFLRGDFDEMANGFQFGHKPKLTPLR